MYSVYNMYSVYKVQILLLSYFSSFVLLILLFGIFPTFVLLFGFFFLLLVCGGLNFPGRFGFRRSGFRKSPLLALDSTNLQEGDIQLLSMQLSNIPFYLLEKKMCKLI